MSNSHPDHDANIHQITHDLLQCLHVIGMATELLRQPQQPTQVDELCRSIDQERKTAAQLVNQLRDAGCDGCR